MKPMIQVIDEIVDKNLPLPTPIIFRMNLRMPDDYLGEITKINQNAVHITFVRESEHGKTEEIKFTANINKTALVGTVDHQALAALKKKVGV